jgi:glutathione-regulated potassium-efflux system ancillary protein KefG
METSNKILIIFAHPLFEKSNVNKVLVKHIPRDERITFRDLYELYPEFDIDVEIEKKHLEAHNIIIWQHPMYWYSCPPLLKQWIDMVLEYDWAYGKKGNALAGKYIFQAITTGGKQENYCATGKDRYTIIELLEPFNQTAKVCKMIYLPPFVVHGTHNISADEIRKMAFNYNQLLHYFLEHEISEQTFSNYFYLNNWFQNTLINGQ